MTASKQNIIVTIILISVACLAFLLKPSYAYVPKGLVLPISKSLTPIPTDQVAILQHQSNSIKPIARIHLEISGILTANQAIPELINRAKQMAAKQGANGLLITELGKAGDKNKMLSLYILQAVAVHEL